MIIREKYLEKIRPFYEQDLIKVIVGVRRCGKSVLLTQIVDELKAKGVEDNQIIYINFEFEKYSDLLNHHEFHNYIEKQIIGDKKFYLFFDEIQKVDKWELAVNSFKAMFGEKVSIFVTGSNSDLLSGELATHIAGRYVSFKVYPFTFKEICEFKKIDDKNIYELKNEFDDYLLWGGMPQRVTLTDEDQFRTYLSDIYDSILVKDIIQRYKIKEIDLFNRIAEYILTTPSQTFSAESLANYLLSDNVEVAKITIYNYLDYMCKALLIHRADRYDVRSKRILNGKYKYYLSDLGIGQVVNREQKKQLGAYLENIVYNELLTRGYDVKVGTLENGEIDFIATKFQEKLYFQVAYQLSDEIIDREFGVYDNIDDHYPKYVISTDTFDFSQNGIIHKNIIDWLLER